MRKIEFGWMHTSCVIGALVMGCGAKTNESAVIGDTGETSVEEEPSTDGSGDGGAETAGETGGSGADDGDTGGAGTDTGATDGGDADTGESGGSSTPGDGSSGMFKEIHEGLYDGETITLEDVVVVSSVTRRGTGFTSLTRLEVNGAGCGSILTGLTTWMSCS